MCLTNSKGFSVFIVVIQRDQRAGHALDNTVERSALYKTDSQKSPLIIVTTKIINSLRKEFMFLKVVDPVILVDDYINIWHGKEGKTNIIAPFE